MDWEIILYVLLSAVLLYVLYQTIRHKKGLFSVDNIIKSLHTLGVLALVLMAFIVFCIWSLQSG